MFRSSESPQGTRMRQRSVATTAKGTFQLGAALLAFDDRPRRRVFVSLDEALAAAAEREGFDAVVPG